jgi:DNA transformation protein and related proteins
MASSEDFVAHVLDLMSDWGGVTAKRMFGGHGIYRQGVMFALIADDALYLKVDAVNQPVFEAAGMKPWTYAGKGKPIVMPYWECPPGALDDSAEMIDLAKGALRAAMAAKAKKARHR